MRPPRRRLHNKAAALFVCARKITKRWRTTHMDIINIATRPVSDTEYRIFRSFGLKPFAYQQVSKYHIT